MNFAPSWFTSTATTTSAPSARTTETGRLATSPPSTSCRPSESVTGTYQPGTGQLAEARDGEVGPHVLCERGVRLDAEPGEGHPPEIAPAQGEGDALDLCDR